LVEFWGGHHEETVSGITTGFRGVVGFVFISVEKLSSFFLTPFQDEAVGNKRKALFEPEEDEDKNDSDPRSLSSILY